MQAVANQNWKINCSPLVWS